MKRYMDLLLCILAVFLEFDFMFGSVFNLNNTPSFVCLLLRDEKNRQIGKEGMEMEKQNMAALEWDEELLGFASLNPSSNY